MGGAWEEAEVKDTYLQGRRRVNILYIVFYVTLAAEGVRL